MWGACIQQVVTNFDGAIDEIGPDYQLYVVEVAADDGEALDEQGHFLQFGRLEFILDYCTEGRNG